MQSIMTSQTIRQNPALYFNTEAPETSLAQRKINAYQAAAPASPIYSRPGSSCSQPPMLYSNGSGLMGSNAYMPPNSHKPVIVLETAYNEHSYLPSTPPLSASGSRVGSPKSCDVLQTPLNPMFSGIDGFACIKSEFDCVESSILDWANCGSPPMTPLFIQSPARGPSPRSTTSDLSSISCPSLSPSPAPYARSVASESDVDFCDPRNLTVSAASNPTLAPEVTFTSLGEEEVRLSEQGHINTTGPSHLAFDFSPAVASGLPAFEELSDFESEDDLSHLVSTAAGPYRPRACTASSVVSLGHGSFIGDEDFSLDESDAVHFPSLPSPPSSVDVVEDAHKDKRQKKNTTHVDARFHEHIMNAAALEDQADDGEKQMDRASPTPSDSNSSSVPGTPSAPLPAPTNRRGRKQSLTEDPSKTFVCDLCNRRFRRQEHLKRHYRSLHTHEKPFECHDCGKKFSRSDNLAQHARTHAVGGGGIVMNLIDNPDVSVFDGSAMASQAADDLADYGKVLFQVAAEIPGSASELSSEEVGDNGKKKRKRSD